MKYTPLSSLQNTYPTPSNYRFNESGNAELQGVYLQNKLEFKLPPNLSDFTIIPNTTFRFVIAISDNNASNQVLDLLISEGLYEDLVRAKQEPNPYFLNTILSPKTWVYIYTDSLHKTFQNQRLVEQKFGVKIDYNVIYDSEGIPDYSRIGRFIDWITSPSRLEDIDNNGVIPLEQLEVKFSLGAYDVESSQWVSAEEASFLAKIDDLEDELRSVRNDIQDIQNFLDNPESFRGIGAVSALMGPAATQLIIGVTQSFPVAAANAAIAAQSVVSKAAAKLAFEGIKSEVGKQTLKQAAGKGLLQKVGAKVGSSLLGGPVGIAVGIAVGIITTILKSKKAKREQEERIRKYNEYIQKITAEQVRLLEREQVLLFEIEAVRNNQPISNTNDSQTNNQNVNSETQDTNRTTSNNTSSGGSTTFIDPFEAERQFRQLQ